MLKGIDPILGPDLLAMLRAMGHGDEIVIADANFPSQANAQRLVRMDGVGAARVVQAIVSLLPLDDAVPNAAFNMAMTGDPGDVRPWSTSSPPCWLPPAMRRAIEPIERHAFYARAREAYGIVATGEPRLLGQPDPQEGRNPSGRHVINVDFHQHFWRLDRGDYGWLTEADHPAIYRDFLPDDLSLNLRRCRVDRTVLVQAAPTEAETLFLLDLADATPFVAGVVGWTDFEARDAPERIAALAQRKTLLGLRPMLPGPARRRLDLRPSVAPAIAAMQAAGLRFDALVLPRHLPVLARFLERHPDLPTVIDHAAKPHIADGVMEPWATHMRAIARDTAALCKVSGLATEAGPGWNTQRLRPYIDVLLEAFGPARLMWGSDWPVLNEAGDYVRWVATANELMAMVPAAERGPIFGQNAAAFYGIA